MSDLSIEELKAKIETVENDIRQLRVDGGNDRKTTILLEYKEYLIDELAQLTNGKNI
jgi:hypothetical protein